MITELLMLKVSNKKTELSTKGLPVPDPITENNTNSRCLVFKKARPNIIDNIREKRFGSAFVNMVLSVEPSNFLQSAE